MKIQHFIFILLSQLVIAAPRNGRGQEVEKHVEQEVEKHVEQEVEKHVTLVKRATKPKQQKGKGLVEAGVEAGVEAE